MCKGAAGVDAGPAEGHLSRLRRRGSRRERRPPPPTVPLIAAIIFRASLVGRRPGPEAAQDTFEAGTEEKGRVSYSRGFGWLVVWSVVLWSCGPVVLWSWVTALESARQAGRLCLIDPAGARHTICAVVYSSTRRHAGRHQFLPRPLPGTQPSLSLGGTEIRS